MATGGERLVSGTQGALFYAQAQGYEATAMIRTAIVAESEVVQRRRSARAEGLPARGGKGKETPPGAPAVDEDSVVVCPPMDVKVRSEARDSTRGHEHAIGKALALTPDLRVVRNTPLAEFPYADGVVDRLPSPLVGRRHVGLAPIPIVGPPDCGKSHLTRRLVECLGVGSWKLDAARANGGTWRDGP